MHEYYVHAVLQYKVLNSGHHYEVLHAEYQYKVLNAVYQYDVLISVHQFDIFDTLFGRSFSCFNQSSSKCISYSGMYSNNKGFGNIIGKYKKQGRWVKFLG